MMQLLLRYVILVTLVYLYRMDTDVEKDFRFCPLGCRCQNQSFSVICNQANFITNIPELPPEAISFKLFGSNIMKISANAFLSAPKLEFIEFNNCKQLKTIDSKAFDGLPSLRTLGFIKTKIITIDTITWQSILNLHNFFLIEGKVQDIHIQNLCVLKQLGVLKLSQNKLNSISFPQCFCKTPKLYKIVLSGNFLNNLTGEDFYGLKDLTIREVYLRNCYLKSLDPSLLKYLKNLTTLDLRENSLFFLPPSIFQGVEQLQVLLLSKNKFTYLPRDALLTIPKIRQLYFDNNKLTSFDDFDIFQNLTSVQLLNLNKNRLVNISNTSLKYLNTSPLRNIFLQFCSLSFIASDAFLGFKHLRQIDISSNPLTVTSLLNLLESIKLNNISQLKLDDLHIYELNSTSFAGEMFVHVTYLSMKKCFIKKLHSFSFSSFPNVAYLNLGRNSIISFEQNSLCGLSNLKILDLSSCKFINIPDAGIVGISKYLKSLYLRKNGLKRIKSRSLKGYQNLEILDLSSNSIKVIENKAFEHVLFLKSLHLQRNNIHSLRQQLMPLHFLTILDLHVNHMESYQNLSFTSLTNLNSLDVNANLGFGNTYFLKADIFRNMSQLKYLKLQQCGIKVIPEKLFWGLNVLKLLALSGNSISSWSPSIFAHLKQLEELYMSKNNILFLNQSSFHYLSSLRLLDLSGNLFTCTCDLVWLHSWLMNNNIYMLNLARKGSYECYAPMSEKGLPLIEFNLTERDCLSLTTLWIGISIAFFFILLVTSLTTIYRLRWYIRYWIYLVRARKKQYRELNDCQLYEFDAFVSYNVNDRHWVINQLLPELEYQKGFRLCLHHRDWLAGRDIEDNIIDSIENSRKTILILSNNFARSQWCQMELTMAQHKLFDGNRNVILVILLEEIKPCYLSGRLRWLLTTKTYIAWPTLCEQQIRKKFWHALSSALKQNDEQKVIPMEVRRN